jgi:hypothetical protein
LETTDVAGSVLSWLRGRGRRRVERERDAWVAAYRADIEQAGQAGDAEALVRLAEAYAAAGLEAEDVELELELLEGWREAHALDAAIEAGHVPTVETTHRAVGSDTCYFLAPAAGVGSDGDVPGKLLLTSRRLLFLGGSMTSLGWTAIGAVEADGRHLVVRQRSGAPIRRFRCNTYVDAKRAWVLGRWLLGRTGRGRSSS